MDSYEGNSREPLSLHKYLYAHSNPINGWDPSGFMTLTNVMTTIRNIGSIVVHYFSLGASSIWNTYRAFKALQKILIVASAVMGGFRGLKYLNGLPAPIAFAVGFVAGLIEGWFAQKGQYGTGLLIGGLIFDSARLFFSEGGYSADRLKMLLAQFVFKVTVGYILQYANLVDKFPYPEDKGLGFAGTITKAVLNPETSDAILHALVMYDVKLLGDVLYEFGMIFLGE